ncbi:zinc-ribbon domain-containing protein [Sabulicella rubraurantiaca]|uniref:zinc-ribbon domain-containing protein n=1 Tax=Sabulicella rubraurantiaca TaxID=2811429 RepID=UPI001A96AB54|nr:zinc-ribbon domain-containing protein [Sabulicella rubraurantiaca]
MDITCPHCGAAYRVPESLLAPGKKLRCSACRQDWVPSGAEPAPPPEAPPPGPAPAASPPPRLEEPPALRPELPPLPRGRTELGSLPPPLMPVAGPRPIRDFVEEPPRRRGGAGLILAWIASLAVLGALAAAVLLRHEEIARAWPPFERVSQLLGG